SPSRAARARSGSRRVPPRSRTRARDGAPPSDAPGRETRSASRVPEFCAVSAIEVDCPCESLPETHQPPPPAGPADATKAAVVASDVDRLAVGREGDQLVGPFARDVDEQLGEFLQAHNLVGTEVVQTPSGLLARCCEEEGTHGIVHVCEVPPLFP